MVDYTEGQRLRIIAGKYKENVFCTFISYCGITKVNVRVDGDKQQQRSIYRSSVRAVNSKDKRVYGHQCESKSPSQRREVGNDEIGMLLSDINALKSMLNDLVVSVQEMEDRVLLAYRKK